MKVALLGYGVEGKANYDYWRVLPGIEEVVVFDENENIDVPEGVRTVLGSGAFKRAHGYDLVVRTASLPPRNIATDGKIWSATNEFFAKCPALIIGVTGTKGKGTTCSLIASILRASGRTVHLVGNIGVPALSVLNDIQPDDVVVYELSSFQLWDLEKSPHVAVVLMVEPDHLNVHVDFNEYADAKSNIAAHQQSDDIVIYHPDNSYSEQIAKASQASDKQRYLTTESAYVADNEIMIDGHQICPIDEVGLLGAYNLENICAAVAASWYFTQDINAMAGALREFKGLEHRLEFVANKSNIDYYNDSFSSAPTATLAAITAFDGPIILIVGGSDKGVDLALMTEKISQTSNIKQVILIGQVKDDLAELFERYDYSNFVVCEATDVDSIVKMARSYARAGDTVLLSPGCASFDMFSNFYERGMLFKRAVNELSE